MASATPDLRLPSQLQGITVHWYQIILLGDRGTCVNNLSRVALDRGEGGGGGWDSNLQPIDHKSSILLPCHPPSHTKSGRRRTNMEFDDSQQQTHYGTLVCLLSGFITNAVGTIDVSLNLLSLQPATSVTLAKKSLYGLK